jgi:hypothetical protein
MKTNLTAESVPVQLPLARAANEDVHGERAVVTTATAAWDPYDIWRTRILPYQRERRLRSLGDAFAIR